MEQVDRRPALKELGNGQLRIVLASDLALVDGSGATIIAREDHAHLHRIDKELLHYVSVLTNELVSAGVPIPPIPPIFERASTGRTKWSDCRMNERIQV